MKIELVGANAVLRSLNTHGQKLGRAFKTGAQVAAEHIITVSRASTPVDTGALRASGIWFARNSGWMTQIYIGHGTRVTGFYKNGELKDPRKYAVTRHDPEEYSDGGWFQRAVDNNELMTIITIQAEMERV
ncbi:MAG: hypothetical protein ACK5S6_05065 [bacterium]